MILNVLQVSRGEEGKLNTQLEEIDIADLARESVAAFRIVAEVDGRHLGIETPQSLSVKTDQMLLRRILYNLIRNALRHTPRGTGVLVRVEAPMPGEVRLSVIDDGPGLPPEMQPYLFERYAAAAVRSSGRWVDSGLGLAFCKTAADALGAALTVHSDGKHGATFALSFPAGG
jgi:signal transduction histidine kinase